MNGEIQKSCPRTSTVLYIVESKNGWKGKELEILLMDGRALEKKKYIGMEAYEEGVFGEVLENCYAMEEYTVR